ncbi:uncharacterized protein LOC128390843 [Panonychus citri]|uniref:uncharacterized protein LOC128390843 n=1 Tax=Panonychus citri TaxID=50023 RepID=UPI002307D926|nr:uncharacterized protein LOC128390843 [Panonychus citri]
MASGWENNYAAPNPRLEAFEQKMEAKQRRKAVKIDRISFTSPSEAIFRQCFLVLSIFAPKFTSYFGHVWRPEIISPEYEISGTPKEMNKYTKLTVTANHPDKIRMAHHKLNQYTELLNYKNSRNSTQIQLIQIPENHCSLCFRSDHMKINCNYCSYCSELVKTDNQVTITAVVQSKSKKNAYVREQRKLRRRKLRAAYGGKPWWKSLNNPIPEQLENYVPIGPKTNKKETLGLDIEGDGHGGVGSVHLSGWFGPEIRIQTVYYAQVKNHHIVNPLTLITGLQINDLTKGLTLDDISMQVAEISRGRRLITQGKEDLQKLQLTPARLRVYNIQHIDLQELWPGKQPIGLVSIDKFLFYKFQKLRREDDSHVTIGHSPERDSRVTLKAYMELQKLTDRNIPIPSAEIVREMVKNGQNISHWLSEFQDGHH